MCGNIKKLRQPDQVPSDEELRLAALQFVRMVSGYRVPAAVNEAAFNTAVERLLRRLGNYLITLLREAWVSREELRRIFLTVP